MKRGFTIVVTAVLVWLQQTVYGFVMYDACLNANTTSPAFLMECSGDGEIVDIKFVAGTGQCNTTECKGESVSLLKDANNCHWNRKCRLSPGTPAQRIVRTSGNCSVAELSFLRVKGYRCFYPEYGTHNEKLRVIIDICDNKTLSRTSGIIRSHAQYPWFYQDSHRKCTLSLVVQRGMRLYVSALDEVDVGEDDVIKVTSQSSMNLTHVRSSEGVLVLSDVSDTNVTFIFEVSDYSQSGRGFAFCFKFSDKAITGNVCDEITARGDLTISHGYDVSDDVIKFMTIGDKESPEKPSCHKKCQKRCCQRKYKGKFVGKQHDRKNAKRWIKRCIRKNRCA